MPSWRPPKVQPMYCRKKKKKRSRAVLYKTDLFPRKGTCLEKRGVLSGALFPLFASQGGDSQREVPSCFRGG